MKTKSQGKNDTAIFERLLHGNRRMPLPMARHLVAMCFSEEDKSRMHELARKNAEGTIKRSELKELDEYLEAGDTLALLQAFARIRLAGKTHERKAG